MNEAAFYATLRARLTPGAARLRGMQRSSSYLVAALVVVADKDDETMVGIISERDILEWISKGTRETYSLTVRDIMTKKVISCDAITPLDEAWEIMRMHNIRNLPVVKDGRPLKMLSLRNLLDNRT
mgnify:CR=1 FL=1